MSPSRPMALVFADACAWCCRSGCDPGQLLLPAGAAAQTDVTPERTPPADLPAAAPARWAARPLRQAVHQGAGTVQRGVAGVSPLGAEGLGQGLGGRSACGPRLKAVSFQMSHLFNVAHSLRMLLQKERSLDILKVSWGRLGTAGGGIWAGLEKAGKGILASLRGRIRVGAGGDWGPTVGGKLGSGPCRDGGWGGG